MEVWKGLTPRTVDLFVSLGNVACCARELVGRLFTLEVGPFH